MKKYFAPVLKRRRERNAKEESQKSRDVESIQAMSDKDLQSALSQYEGFFERATRGKHGTMTTWVGWTPNVPVAYSYGDLLRDEAKRRGLL